MFAAFHKVVRDDAPSHRVWKFNHLGPAGRLLVENRFQFRSFEKDPVRSVFSLVKLLLHLFFAAASQIQRPHFDVRNLKRIKHVHRNCVRSLVCQVPTNSCSQAFFSLTHVDRLFIVIEKSIHTAFVCANLLPTTKGLEQFPGFFRQPTTSQNQRGLGHLARGSRSSANERIRLPFFSRAPGVLFDERGSTDPTTIFEIAVGTERTKTTQQFPYMSQSAGSHAVCVS